MGVFSELLEALPAGASFAPSEIEARYFGDWMVRNEAAAPVALIRPRTTAEVATLLKICGRHGVPVVVQGGRTGLAGGATPVTGCVLVSLENMNTITAVDRTSSTVIVEAGAVLEAVQRVAEGADLLFPLDIGGRGSCTIGGNIATNAGGNRVLRYGMMRELVLGLEAVLADGTILTSLNTMQKNNSGYDLKQLFIGSEGTLGIVTRAVLRLFPKPSSVQTVLCAVADYADVLRLLDTARARLGANLAAFEVMWPYFYRLACQTCRPPLAAGHGAYVLVENMGTDAIGDEIQFQSFIEAAFEAGIIADAVVAPSIKARQDIWAMRDSSGSFPQTFWPNAGFDVSLPIGAIGRFIDDCGARLAARWPQVETVWFGHVADSNIHIAVRIAGVTSLPENEINAVVYDCVGEYQGSISAEHGIGLLKKAYLDKSRTIAEIDTMRLLKRALDPTNILNPGKMLCL